MDIAWCRYTLSFVHGMERTHGRTKRTLELVRRELDSNGNPHAQPPRMVNTSLSRDEVERAEREGMQRRNTALLQQNLKSEFC